MLGYPKAARARESKQPLPPGLCWVLCGLRPARAVPAVCKFCTRLKAEAGNSRYFAIFEIFWPYVLFSKLAFQSSRFEVRCFQDTKINKHLVQIDFDLFCSPGGATFTIKERMKIILDSMKIFKQFFRLEKDLKRNVFLKTKLTQNINFFIVSRIRKSNYNFPSRVWLVKTFSIRFIHPMWKNNRNSE